MNDNHKTPQNRAEYDAIIINGADYFTACVSLGRGRYRTERELPNIPAARAAGIALIQEVGNGKPAMIYAVKNGLTAHVENVAI